MDIYDRDDLAGSFRADVAKPLLLWAGESEKVTETRTLADGVSFKKYEVYALDEKGNAIKATAGAKARGFTAQPVKAGAQYVQGYIAGSPNHEALVWPDGVNDFESRRALFYGTSMYVEKLKLNPLP